jgi:chain length determinant protein EpsF
MSLERVFTVLWARRAALIAVVFGCVTIAAVASFLAPKKYVAELTLVVDIKGSDPLAETALSSPLLSTYVATQREIIASRNVALKVIDALGLAEGTPSGNPQIDPRTAYIGTVLTPLETSSAVNSNLIKISYGSDDPETAARFANAIGAAYIQTSLELQVDPARRQAAWFDEQVDKLREDLAKAQGKLDAYQRGHGVLGVDEDRLDIENVRLQEISSQLVKAQAALVEAETRSQVRSSAELPDLLGNPLLQTLKSELARSEAKLADLSQRVDRNHPQFRSAAAEVATLRAQLDAEMATAKSSLLRSAELARQQVRETQAALKEQKERIIALRQGRDELSVLQRDVESARATYAAALQQANQTRLESRIDRTNIAILNPATIPAGPASPRIALNIVLAFIVSALCAAGWILYGEFVRPRVRSSEDLDPIADLPVLAELPPMPRPALPHRSKARRPAPALELRPRAT